MFHIYHVLLVAIYIYSIGITMSSFPKRFFCLGFLALFLVLTAFHSPFASGFLFSGLAGYSILGTTLQPSAFGVFLLFSACWYLRGRLFRSVVCAALTAALHPIYLLSAIILIGTYMVLTARERGSWKQVLGEGAAGLAIMAPILAYVILAFSPSSPEAAQQAREILVTYRMPHHTMPTI